MSRPKIVVSLTGGLGNQLFQFAAALDQAGESVFGIDQNLGLPTLSPDGRPELAEFALPINARFEAKRAMSRFTMRSTNFTMLIGKSATRRRTGHLAKVINILSSMVLSVYLKEPRKIHAAKGLGYYEVEKILRRAFLVGYFQSYRWASNPSTLQKLKNMKLSSDSELIQKLREVSAEEKPLIVHIRLGDYTKIPSFGIPSNEYYKSAIEKHMKAGICKKVWLFSNEPEKAMAKIPMAYRDQIRIIHEVEGSSAKTLEAMRLGWGYVIANSTYSWWGAFLSYTDHPLVIAPTPWFKTEQNPNELIPPEWHLEAAWPEEK